MRAARFVIPIVVLAAVIAQAQSPMRAGRWQVSMQMEMPNMPAQMPPMTTTQCVTEEQLKKDPATGLPTGMQGNPNACKVSDYKQTANTVSWKVACTGQQPMTGTGALTFAEDSYTGTINMSMPQGAMTMKMTGKRLGECSQ